MGYGDFGLYRLYTPFLDKSVLKITPITLIVYIPKSRLFVRVIYNIIIYIWTQSCDGWDRRSSCYSSQWSQKWIVPMRQVRPALRRMGCRKGKAQDMRAHYPCQDIPKGLILARTNFFEFIVPHFWAIPAPLFFGVFRRSSLASKHDLQA